MTRFLLFFIAVSAFAAQPVFDGKTLAHWHAVGNASWSVEDGAIVGRQGPNGGAGELLTDGMWANFELELEWKMRFPGNSGIWFRYVDAQHAYQADILDEPKAYPDALSGSVYCMGKAFIARNSDAASVKKDDWNRMLIRAVGDEITIVLNGKEVVRVADSTVRQAGRIRIQVHPGKAFENMENRVKNLRLRVME